MIFQIIAYKENSADYCRGCLMDRYDSGHFFGIYKEVETDIDQLVKDLADLIFRNKNLKINEDRWRICILADGIQVGGDLFPDHTMTLDESEEWDWDKNDSMNEVSDKFMKLALEKVAVQEEKIKLEQETQIARQKIQEYKRIEEKEKLDLERLRSKYGTK